jgi:predicted metal-dependent HD superfamily phosphohydrolase
MSLIHQEEPNLKSHWEKTCEGHVSEEKQTEWFIKLSNHYSEPTRAYHTLKHIQELIKWSIRYEDELEDINGVALAIWFHEYVLIRQILRLNTISKLEQIQLT